MELNKSIYSTFMEFKYESSSLPNEWAIEKTNITYFIFILPTLTLGPKFAPFLSTPEDIDYIYEILAQFWWWINHVFPQGYKKGVTNSVSTKKLTSCGSQLYGSSCCFLFTPTPRYQDHILLIQWYELYLHAIIFL